MKVATTMADQTLYSTLVFLIFFSHGRRTRQLNTYLN